MNAPFALGPVLADKVRFCRLTLVSACVGRSHDKRRLSLWRCECGADVVAPHGRVTSGQKKSCGCWAADRNKSQAQTHGGRHTREYSSWSAMRRRCLAPDDKDFNRYGGRGITICEDWNDFAKFVADVGARPDGTTLDRIDPRKGYEPGNVRWATAQVQGRNRRGTFIWTVKGREFDTAAAAAAFFGVSAQSVWRWVNGSIDVRRNTFTPPRSDCSVRERFA